ncbi:hypothetical protein FRAAL0820 [Frankia alni ACN14a]|uniref:Uncharacterized protein n=1 Tax=Frankia alni (strain DSM 45986 / CECT 9034 / ACN14a) TaxID=326424 RepID=Q0RSH3_FRAAA|nr:hypothetical protein FRAAL0820 [Frankia alni ACN14a]
MLQRGICFRIKYWLNREYYMLLFANERKA